MSTTLLVILLAVLVIGVAAYFLFFRKRESVDLSDDERAILKAKIFDQFEIKGVRKRALLSTMYRAIDTETKKAVALRILRPEFSSDPDQVKSFLRRGEILEYLNKQHPDLALVRLLKYGQAQSGRLNRAFIAVEFFEGTDLSELLDRRKVLTVTDATQIITQIARTLSVALRERVWHHQLAFQAIMVREEERGGLEAKLVDFDVVKQEGAASSAQATEGISKLTFMSPEQFDNKIVDERSDIYSLGVIYYTLLTGRPPFVGDDFGEMARLHTSVPPPPLGEHVPSGVQSVVLRMLDKQPLGRYRTMDEAVRAVESLRRDESWNRQPDTSGVKPLPRRTEESRNAPGRAPERKTGERAFEPTPAARAVRRAAPSPSARKLGGFLSLILLEFPLMFVSGVGRGMTKLVQKFTVKKLVIALLIIVVGVGAYLLFRSNAVTGSLAITVTDAQKKGIPNVEVAVDPVGGGGTASESAVFIDPVSEQKSKGKASGKTDNKGEFRVKCEVPPGTRVAVSISAAEFVPSLTSDTVGISADSTVSLSYVLAAKPKQGPKILTVFVRDRAKNPVPSVTVLITGKSGTEQSVMVDARGKATLTYDPSVEGSAPKVELAAEGLGPAFAHSKPKEEAVAGSKLDIDMNDFFPYDETIDQQMKQARFLVSDRDWKKAIPVLKQVVSIRPGQGSAEAYTLLAKATFEEDDDNYKEALSLLDKAMEDRSTIAVSGAEPVLETLHFYRVRVTYEAYDRLKSSDPTRPTVARQVLRACNEYRDLYRGARFKALLQRDKKYKSDLEDVDDYGEKVK